MFNFNELKIIKENESDDFFGSFVGIRKHDRTGEMVFNLPKGFNDFQVDYDNVKQLFFMMYKTFKKFYLSRINSDSLLDNKPQSKDNVKIDNQEGYRFADEDNNEVILYSKIDLIDNILKIYQSLEIESIIQEVGIVEDIDYSKIEQMLDRAVFLKNHTIFVEQDIGKRNIVRGVPSELIQLYCYIYRELSNELGEDISDSIKQISDSFAYQHLNPEQSLFDENSFEETVSILKSTLDNIHRITPYKNTNYWDIYEAIEQFLYGNLVFDNQKDQQSFWGINNFSKIWEDMCNYTMFQMKNINILYCDTSVDVVLKDNLEKRVIDRYNNILIDKNFENNFYIKFSGKEQEKQRWMRPDIIYKNNSLSGISIRNMIDIGILVDSQKSSDVLGVTGNIDVSLKLQFNATIDEKTSSDIKKRFEAIYTYFKNQISNYYKKKDENRFEREQIDKKLRNLRTRSNVIKNSVNIQKLNNEIFIIKSIPKDIYKKFNDDLLSQDDKKNFSSLIFLSDWKYITYEKFKQPDYQLNSNIKVSITKQLLYEFCLIQQKEQTVINQFCVPYYFSKIDNLFEEEEILDCGLGLVKVNFQAVQAVYLNG